MGLKADRLNNSRYVRPVDRATAILEFSYMLEDIEKRARRDGAEVLWNTLEIHSEINQVDDHRITEGVIESIDLPIWRMGVVAVKEVIE